MERLYRKPSSYPSVLRPVRPLKSSEHDNNLFKTGNSEISEEFNQFRRGQCFDIPFNIFYNTGLGFSVANFLQFRGPIVNNDSSYCSIRL